MSPEMLHQTNTNISDLLFEGFKISARTQFSKEAKSIVNDFMDHNLLESNRDFKKLSNFLWIFMF